MKKVFFDTNVIVSSIIMRNDSVEASASLSACDFGLVEGCVSLLTVANAAYIIKKGRTVVEMKYILESSLEGLNVLPMDDNQLQKALKVDAPDFEDVLQYECAKAGNCDLIVTSNIKHFKFSDIEVMSTADFATKFSKRI